MSANALDDPTNPHPIMATLRSLIGLDMCDPFMLARGIGIASRNYRRKWPLTDGERYKYGEDMGRGLSSL